VIWVLFPIAVRVYPDLKPTQPQRKAPLIDGVSDGLKIRTFDGLKFPTP
jgi:hypothetical protein